MEPVRDLPGDVEPTGQDWKGSLPLILSYGMGVESSYWLVRVLTESKLRDFLLFNLVVVTAQTGSEWPDTKYCVETFIYPLLKKLGVRTVQLARGAVSSAGGLKIAVLEDTRSPEVCHTRPGLFGLADELLAGGTVVQKASGNRSCSIKWKGEILDGWLEREFGSLPRRQVIGFNASETGRAERDKSYSKENRFSEYPLIKWGVEREQCLDYLKDFTGGMDWPKSACWMCPYSLAHAIERFSQFPMEAAEALLMEHLALALNPSQAIYGDPRQNPGARLLDNLQNAGVTAPIQLFETKLEHTDWGIYRVRRLFYASVDRESGRTDKTKRGGNHRSTELLCSGTRHELEAELARGGPVERIWGSLRRNIRYRKTTYPTSEEFLVVAPALAKPKQIKTFEVRWAKTAQQDKYRFDTGEK